MKEWKEPERKFCKECRAFPTKSSIYKVHSEKIMIKLPVDYDETGKFEYWQIEKLIEVFVCSNKHVWVELNNL